MVPLDPPPPEAPGVDQAEVEVQAEARAEVAENCGAGRTWANPLLATWRLSWWRFSSEPRGIPIPAEPALSIMREGVQS